MRNRLLIGLSTVAAIILCFQNCGMNYGQNANPIDPRLIVTPLADSHISINQGDDIFKSPAPTDASNTSPSYPANPNVPSNSITQVTVSSSPAECTGGYVATEYLSARLGFSFFGMGGMFCQYRGGSAQQYLITDFKAVSGTACPSGFAKTGMLNVDHGNSGIANVSICVKFDSWSSATTYITAIYIGIVDPSTPALRCKTGDTDAGSVGPTYAVCLRH